MAHTKKISDKLGYKLYYYHDINNREIDLIIEKETSDGFDDLYLYYEIKMTKDADTAVVKFIWINDINVPTYGIVVGKSIIYDGQNEINNTIKETLLHERNNLSRRFRHTPLPINNGNF